MKLVDTPTLRRMLARAESSDWDRLLPARVKAALDPAGYHVLSQTCDHNDGQNVRCLTALLKLTGRDEPYEAVLDFSYEDWNALPEHHPRPKKEEVP